ncbi:SLATT domain-containing protein [Pseudomonas sp. Y39-6]|uniref:SLATT domain-containing protein n=1 Tax=Pseudomonas sp. Y39-6 TaxID=2749807 RepID=UPI00202CC02A|nr:SLATT domain-containing protein [Pseudomonas sp. Y39-6]URS59289.1 SLATT domain-containing protein [Pseudomonas sp. Y39-6]
MSSDLELPESSEALLKKWYTRCSTAAVGHYKTAERYSKFNANLTGLAAVFSTIIGTTVFATLQDEPSLCLRIFLGAFSLAAAVLAALSATMGFQDKAEKHRTAGSKYNSAGRELEQLGTNPSITQELLEKIRTRLDALAEESPHLPRRVHNEIADSSQLSNWKK